MPRISVFLTIMLALFASSFLAPASHAQENDAVNLDNAAVERLEAKLDRLEAKVDLLSRLLEAELRSEQATLRPASYAAPQRGNKPPIPPAMDSGLRVEVEFCASRGPSFGIATELLGKVEIGGNGNLGNGFKGGAGVNPATGIGPNAYGELNLVGEWDFLKLGLGGEWKPRDLNVCLTLPPRPLVEDIDTMEVKDKFERRIDRMTKRLLRRILGKEPDEVFEPSSVSAQADSEPANPLDDLLIVDQLLDTVDLRTSPQGLVDKLRDPNKVFEGFQATVAQLPLPGQLADLGQDPAGALQGFLPQDFNDLFLCDFDLGAGLFAQICSIAESADHSILNLQSSLDTIKDEVTTFCNGVNSRFRTIRNGSIGTFVNFPILDSTVLTNLGTSPFRPFSNVSNVSCPAF